MIGSCVSFLVGIPKSCSKQKVEDEDESICFFVSIIVVGNLQTFWNELGLNPVKVSMFKRLDAQDVNVSQSGHGFGSFTLVVVLRQYCLSHGEHVLKHGPYRNPVFFHVLSTGNQNQTRR